MTVRSREPFWHLVVDNGDGCWLWTGYVNDRGYGIASFVRDGKHAATTAHRRAYNLMVGPVPDGLQLDHLCRVRLCVNPYHMEPVTPAENTRRSRHGEMTHCKRGHLFDVANTRVDRRGSRQCRACLRTHMARYRARQALAA